MKKTLLIALSLLIGMVYVNAQDFYFGPKTGLNFSYANSISDASKRTGFVIGMFAEKPLNNWFSIQTELLCSTEGFKVRNRLNDEESYRKTYKMDYISVPVLAKIYMKGGFNIQFGAKFGVMIKSKYSVSNDLIYGGSSNPEKSGGIENKNKFSTSFVTGLGYDFNCGLLLECRYSLGINKLGSEEYWDGAARLGSLQLVTGWKF